MTSDFSPSPLVFIHVGFANTGTSSLQRNFFATRRDISYLGVPYEKKCNGLFAAIKHGEQFRTDNDALIQLRNAAIEEASAGGGPLVISDETLSDAHQLYFAPYLMPRDVIADRLKFLFPSARIIFTIRDQRQYAETMYLNLKRNCAKFSGMPVPPFSEWLSGNLALLRSQYLQNLNFAECIGLYATMFGLDKICVLPLEMASADGAHAYLGRLCSFMGIELRQEDVIGFKEVRNRRMSVREDLVAELFQDQRFRQLYRDLQDAIGSEQLTALLEAAPRTSVTMTSADESEIRRRIEVGNSLLACEFELDLERYGYLLAEGQKFRPGSLGIWYNGRRPDHAADAIKR